MADTERTHAVTINSITTNASASASSFSDALLWATDLMDQHRFDRDSVELHIVPCAEVTVDGDGIISGPVSSFHVSISGKPQV